MISFENPDDFPKSGFFLTYDSNRCDLRDVGIFQVDEDYVECILLMTSTYHDGYELELSTLSNLNLKEGFCRYSRDFYIESFYVGNDDLHFILSDDEYLNHIIVESI